MDETLDRPVSVRVVRPGHRYTADVVDAARRAALVGDPRLIRVLDVGESGGTAFIVAEHLVGRTLEQVLADGPLPAETARRIIGETAEALDRASARGLHHLRLTPASVVVAPDGSVKVLGTAVEAALAGAEHDEDPVGADRSDAVGLVHLLYAALTGRWPGTPDSALEPAPEVAGRAVPPGDLAPGVPNDLDTLCTVALGPHDDGPRSPGELAAQLTPWKPTEPLSSPRGLALGTAVPARSAGSGGARPGINGTPLPSAPRTVLERPEEPGRTGAAAEAPRAARSPRPARTSRPATQLPGGVPVGAGGVPSRSGGSGGSGSGGSGSGGSGGSGGTGGSPGGGPLPPPGAPPPGRRPAEDDWSLLTPVHLVLPTVTGPEQAAPQEEPLGPFIPPAPVARPPRDQARFVIALVAGLVVLGLVLAIIGVYGMSTSPPLVEPGPAIPSLSTSAGRAPGPASSTGAASGPATPVASTTPATPSPSSTPAAIAAIEAIDPQGDGDENGSTAVNAIDGDSSTSWRSARYQTADFGGLKHGLGLYLKLDGGRVSTVTVSMPGTGGTVELRTATGPGLDSSVVVATAQAANGTAVLTPTRPLPAGTDSLLLWFTSLPQQSSGEYRLVVSEIAVS